jgi:hypothetical protein
MLAPVMQFQREKETYRFLDCSELFKLGAKRRIIRMPS